MSYQELVTIPSGEASMEGMFALPPSPRGVVLFAHGSGSSRLSPRNNYVASVLREAGIGTLLLDLLSPSEEGQVENRFDIYLLTARLADAAAWLRMHPAAASLPLGLFGASTGAAAALQLAAIGPAVTAIVSRGGRPDLAGQPALSRVRAPTLLIVGGADQVVLGLNRKALAELQCEKELTIVPNATHLFEEPGALEQVASLATSWFARHLFHPDVPDLRQPPTAR